MYIPPILFIWLRKYPNLIRDFKPTAPNQLWVSDITYFKAVESFIYIRFITDAYSHKIVGYHAAQNLEAIETLQALKMALEALREPFTTLIHHSDRGIQYCSSDYTSLLTANQIKISMTENGDPLENAVAERVNGILKEEYLEHYTITSLQEAKECLDQAVTLYNNERPHMSIGLLTPDTIHLLKLKTEKLWKNNRLKRNVVNSFQE